MADIQTMLYPCAKTEVVPRTKLITLLTRSWKSLKRIEDTQVHFLCSFHQPRLEKLGEMWVGVEHPVNMFSDVLIIRDSDNHTFLHREAFSENK